MRLSNVMLGDDLELVDHNVLIRLLYTSHIQGGRNHLDRQKQKLFLRVNAIIYVSKSAGH